MPKYSEDTLTSWTKPPSDSEQARLETSERMVREAISQDKKLSKESTETFGQGSYANDTNVRLNSDIDINVRYTGGFYYDLPKETVKEDFGLTSPSSYSYSEFKDDVEAALVKKFGRADVTRNDKCITIKGTAQRVQTDVVPTWSYRRYATDKSYILGSKFQADSGLWVENFPKQHIENGIKKNSNTQRRFKRLTRLHRKLRYKMKDDGVTFNTNITSFLLECLVWNVPNKIMNEYDTWTERLKQSIIYIYNQTKDDTTCKEWGEVSELLYLFHAGRKWSRKDVNEYMFQLWNYLKF
ncbi:MAG TPA: nucleotidyltransferase [Chitinophagales bacterium]|nr:nucleotidyltransferase [Chitinophagales bacterium]